MVVRRKTWFVRSSITVLVTLGMLLAPVLDSVAKDGPDEGPPSSRFLVWEDEKLLTDDLGGHVAVDMVIDSNDDLHLVWVNRTGNIFYGKMDANDSFLVGPRIIATTDRGEWINVSSSIDDNDNVHITWSNDSGPLGAREFDYLKLGPDGSFLLNRSGVGGDDIQVNANGFQALRFYNNSTPSAPEYGPLQLFFYDQNGNLDDNITVGEHQMGFEEAHMLVGDTGDTYLVYLHNGTSLNYTKVVNRQVNVERPGLVQSTGLLSPRLSLDKEGLLQMVWIDERANPNYTTSGIYRARIDLNGVILSAPAFLETRDYEDAELFVVTDISITDSRNNLDIAVISNNYKPDGSGGGDELPELYNLIIFDKDGEVKERQPTFLKYCSRNFGDTPAMVLHDNGTYLLAWGERKCKGPGGGSYDKEDLHFMRSKGNFFIDLAIAEEDVTYPDMIFIDEDFSMNITVRNLATYNSTGFRVTVNYSDNGTVIDEFMAMLEAGGNLTSAVDIALDQEVNITIAIDPLANPDIDLDNNILDMTLSPRARPDLAITSMNISYSKIRPVTGEMIDINVAVSNLGGLGAEADVFFSDGINGTIIGMDHIVTTGPLTFTSVPWNATPPGLHTIAVWVQNSTPAEGPSDLDNNFAIKEILVGSPSFPTVVITSPENGSEVQIGEVNITGIAHDPDGGPMDVFVRVNSSAWEPVAGTYDGSTFEWFILWDLSDLQEGEFDITARVVDDIHENLTTNRVTLVPPPLPILLVNWTPTEDPVINENETISFGIGVIVNINCVVRYEWYVDKFAMNGSVDSPTLDLRLGFQDAGVYNVSVKAVCGSFNVSHDWLLTVIDVNRPPKYMSSTPDQSSTYNVGDNITFSMDAIDLDLDPLTYEFKGMGKIQITNSSTLTVEAKEVGNYTVTVSVYDWRGGYLNYTWNIEVKEGSQPPGPATTSGDDGPWWIIIVIIGVILVLIMIYYYRKGVGTATLGNVEDFKDVEDEDDGDEDEEEKGPDREDKAKAKGPPPSKVT